MDLTITDEDVAFREEVRAFLDDALTPELRRAGRYATSIFSDYDASIEWQKILYAKGWAAPDWPVEYGGTGWSMTQRTIFREECARAGAPVLLYMGLLMLGPVLIKYGTERQKAELLPRILSTEDRWCQGYSEPNAGSDLASLQTRALREGDHYVVNGTKIWTSYAHRSNKIFCLVRTSSEGKPQAGISFLLIDMSLPGVSVEPIVSIDGEVEQCQVFFDDVRVPADCIVGRENQGWEIAKYLLEFERGVFNYYPGLQQQIGLFDRMAREIPGAGGCLQKDDPVFMSRLTEVDIDCLALQYLEHRIKASLAVGNSPGTLSSLVKLVGAELGQSVDELGVELRGVYVAPRQNHVLQPDFKDTDRMIGPPEGAALMNRYLNNRASTIYGGTVQIQRNIIARMLLQD